MSLITKLAFPSASGLLEVGKAGLKLVGGVRAAVFLTAALFFAVSSHHYHNKADSLSAQIETAAVQDRVDRANLHEAQEKVTVKVVTKYVEKQRKNHEVSSKIKEVLPDYVPTGMFFPGSFRVFFDASIEGRVPDPAAVANAAPVTAEDVARTTADNAEIYRDTADRLVSLQEWVTEQQQLQVKQEPVKKKHWWSKKK